MNRNQGNPSLYALLDQLCEARSFHELAMVLPLNPLRDEVPDPIHGTASELRAARSQYAHMLSPEHFEALVWLERKVIQWRHCPLPLPEHLEKALYAEGIDVHAPWRGPRDGQ